MDNKLISPHLTIETGASRILAVQAFLVTGTAWFFYFYQHQLAAQAAMYGGCIVMFNLWLTNRRLRYAAQVARDYPGKEVNILYFAALQRFVFTLGFFILGMGVLAFPPVPLLIAFAIAHLGYLFNRR